MISDRGEIKWTAMMLPEHKDLINKMYDRILHETEKPLLSEDKLEEFDKIIQEAFSKEKTLKFFIYENKRIIEVTGKIVKINLPEKSLIINSGSEFKGIKANSLVKIADY